MDPLHSLLAQLEGGGLSPAETVQLLSDAVAAHPGDGRLLVLLAAEWMEQGDRDRAEAAYISALTHDPSLAVARFQLGLLQFTSSRPAAAIATWAPLQLLGDEDPLRLFAAALEAVATGDAARAASLLQQGIGASKTSPALARDMERILADILSRPAAGAADAQDEPEVSSHVLLTAYQRPH